MSPTPESPDPTPTSDQILSLAESATAVVRAAARLVDRTSDGGTEFQEIDTADWADLSLAVTELQSAIPALEQPAEAGHAMELVSAALRGGRAGVGVVGTERLVPIWCVSVAVNMTETIEIYIASPTEPSHDVIAEVWSRDYPETVPHPQGWKGPLVDCYPYVDQVFQVKIHSPRSPAPAPAAPAQAPADPVVGGTPDPGTCRELYVFFRRDNAGELYFYPVEVVPGTLDEHIALNPGTVRVEDTGGRLMWREPQS